MAKKRKAPTRPAGEYRFSDAPRAFKNADKADANEIGQSLDEIANAHSGRLKPRDIVEVARTRTHPLHRYFEWNDETAAAGYRLDQARALCRCVVALPVEGTDTPPRRAWYSIDDPKGISYRHVTTLNEADLQYALMRRAERDLHAFEQRYAEIADICALIRTARQRVAARLAGHEGEGVAA